MSVYSDPALVEEAEKTAAKTRRTIRRLGEMPYTDMVIYEDQKTGERRCVPNKARLTLGVAVSFELSSPITEVSASA
jgi:hypothetical protein